MIVGITITNIVDEEKNVAYLLSGYKNDLRRSFLYINTILLLCAMSIIYLFCEFVVINCF